MFLTSVFFFLLVKQSNASKHFWLIVDLILLML